MIQNLRPLTQEQRQGARQSAREAVLRVIGPKPVREHFAGETISRYPAFVTRLITFLCLILLLAAFTPSAIRLYVIGSQTFGQAVPNQTAKNVVGLATVLSAEVGQVVFSLALATLGASVVPAACSMPVCSVDRSLCGQRQLSLIDHAQSLFGWLEAIAPPLVVLVNSLRPKRADARSH
jgi:hypothetical protein